MNKTKESIINFRRQGYTHRAIPMHDEKMEIIHSYKYFGKIFEDTLRWDFNTEAITRKGTSDSICCGSSDLFNANPTILKLFYHSFIENVLTFSFNCWFYNLNTKRSPSLQRIVNFTSKIICDQARTLSLLCDQDFTQSGIYFKGS